MTTAQTLDAFLTTVRDARAYRRALIVQLCERGHQQNEVARLLHASEAFVSTCRKKYAQDGVASFALGYQGGASFLSADERADVLAWIAAQKRPNVKVLYGYLKDTFGVIYVRVAAELLPLAQGGGPELQEDADQQSPKNEATVATKRAELEAYVAQHLEAIERGVRGCCYAWTVLSPVGRCLWLCLGQAQRTG